MSAPTAAVRSQVMDRDGYRCVAGFELAPLEFQHRQAVGMGGSLERPGYVDGLAACAMHNGRFESDLQLKALVYGWKVKRWVSDAGAVPVLYWQERSWARLTVEGFRVFISQAQALAMMHAVYGPEVYDEWRAEL